MTLSRSLAFGRALRIAAERRIGALDAKAIDGGLGVFGGHELSPC
jgi:hypothetical protein